MCTDEENEKQRDAEKKILTLEKELDETNRGVVALNLELEKRVEEKERAEAALKEVNRELEAFSYSVSHDLKAPLRAIDGFSRILCEKYNETMDEEGKHLISMIHDNVGKMGRLIDDILAFSRVGRQDMNISTINIDLLVREIVKETTAICKQNIKWIITDLPEFNGDRSMIRQVFVNLISNAVKYSSKKQNPQIEICCRKEENELVFFVRDNGIGFDMKFADKLFDVFSRLHSAKEFEGTGIGLANVKRIVNRHGGRVWAGSTIGEEAVFYFSIPNKAKSKKE